MQYQKSLIILLVAFSFSKLMSQKLELGKVSIAELTEKTHPKDPSAVAAILFKKGEVRFEYSQTVGFVMMTEVKTRIKIYKKEGYDWANQKVMYYLVNNSKENVVFSNAVTYNLVDGKIEKSKLKSDGQFDEKINKFWGQKKITMPNIKEGCIIEFEYTITSPNIGTINEWNFQTSIPVNFSEYKTYIPEYFVYNPRQKGFIFPKVSVEKNQKFFVVNSKERTGGGGFSTVSTSFSESKIDYTETATTYLAEDLAAIKDESFVNNIDNYTSSITNELSVVRYPNSPEKQYSTDWDTVTKKIYDNDDFGPELSRTGYFEDDINTLVKGLNTRDEKIVAIFNFVKAKVKWNGYYGYSCNEGVKKAYNDKTGNVAEINLMLTSMLRYVGIDANPVLVSTRSNGIAFFPNRTAFNYVISAVEIQDDLILLDATEKFATLNILPLRDLNWYGRLIRKEGTSTEVDLMPKTASREIVNMNITLNKDGSVDGKIRNQFTDNLAFAFRQKNAGTSKDNYLEELENRNNHIEINDYVRSNESDISNPVVETYSFKGIKEVEIINDKMYVLPLFFLTETENPFKQEVREYPIDFGYPVQTRYNINIEFPEGYKIESLPKNLNSVTGENVGAFKYVIGSDGNRIQIIVTKDINTAIVPADFYDVLKEFYKKAIEKQNEKIVLIKK